MTKFWADEQTQRTYELLSRALGEYGSLLPGSRIPIPMNGFLNSRSYSTVNLSLAAGSTEIQKNIIAQRGLGLPR